MWNCYKQSTQSEDLCEGNPIKYQNFAEACNLESERGDPEYPENFSVVPYIIAENVVKLLSKSTHNLLTNGWISKLGSQHGDLGCHQNLT